MSALQAAPRPRSADPRPAHIITAPEARASLASLLVQGAAIAYGEGMTAMEAARKVLAEHRPDVEASQHLLLIGLAREIQETLDVDRVDAATQSERRRNVNAVTVRPARTLTGDVLADLYLTGIDGLPKPLLRFRLDDWRRLADMTASEMQGAARRNRAAVLAKELLAVEGQVETSALSDDAKARLRNAVSEAWS